MNTEMAAPEREIAMSALMSQGKVRDPAALELGLKGRKYDPVTWAEFINSTTFHGVRFIFEKTHRVRRCVRDSVVISVAITMNFVIVRSPFGASTWW